MKAEGSQGFAVLLAPAPTGAAGYQPACRSSQRISPLRGSSAAPALAYGEECRSLGCFPSPWVRPAIASEKRTTMIRRQWLLLLMQASSVVGWRHRFRHLAASRPEDLWAPGFCSSKDGSESGRNRCGHEKTAGPARSGVQRTREISSLRPSAGQMNTTTFWRAQLLEAQRGIDSIIKETNTPRRPRSTVATSDAAKQTAAEAVVAANGFSSRNVKPGNTVAARQRGQLVFLKGAVSEEESFVRCAPGFQRR